MRYGNLNRTLCVLLALILVLTGLGLGQTADLSANEQEMILSCAALILPDSGITRTNPLFQEEQLGTLQLVQRAKPASKLHTLHSGDGISAEAIAPLATISHGPVRYSSDWTMFSVSSW